ncbi:PTS transporter subunit EIIC [Candidatus Stoquefichus massiliensis]|uniref:PTS transporter subunit EIIC n=1 Tax=Candidatus Stoquefichus massiliensis TaxID=1470350 RepID=UPI000487DB71|nr:PTS transporter subunit EIIC [Candidatus Stoquefichus massiliensis]
MKYEVLASAILERIGGKENVSYATHCMTRLRFNMKDESLVDQEAVKSIESVMGCQFSGGQFQIIIGPGVDKVYAKVCELGGFAVEELVNENLDFKKKEKISIKVFVNRILDGIAGCLTPIIPILICAGLIKMIVALIGPSMLNLVSESSDIFRLFTFVGDAGFYFFPVFVGLSGAKKFGCNPMIALFMGCILLHPSFVDIVNQGNPFSVYGIPMTLTQYSSTVLPMIMITFVMSYLEKYLRKWIPDAVSTLFVPLLTILMMLPIGLCVLGPLGSVLGIYIGEVLMWLRDIFGPFGVALIGAVYILIVATGMHLPLMTTAIVSMTTIGYDNTVLVGAIVAVYTSMAVSLGVMLKSKNAQTKSLGLSCFISQFLGGVGEPTIFGIMFRYRKTLIYSMIGTFIGGLYAAFMNVAVYFAGSSNFLMALSYSGENTGSLIHGWIACAIGFTVTFALMLVLGFESEKEVEPA